MSIILLSVVCASVCKKTLESQRMPSWSHKPSRRSVTALDPSVLASRRVPKSHYIFHPTLSLQVVMVLAVTTKTRTMRRNPMPAFALPPDAVIHIPNSVNAEQP